MVFLHNPAAKVSIVGEPQSPLPPSLLLLLSSITSMKPSNLNDSVQEKWLLRQARLIREAGFDVAFSSEPDPKSLVLLAGNRIIGITPVTEDPCESVDNLCNWLRYLMSADIVS